MPVSEKKRITNDRYNFKCDAILLRPIKCEGERIRKAAKDSGQSLQGFILDAVDKEIKRKEDGDEIPPEFLTGIVNWLKEHGHSEKEVVDCIESAARTKQ